MAPRRHVPIAPATNVSHQDHPYNQGAGYHSAHQSIPSSGIAENHLNNTSPPMAIPGTRHNHPPPPRALPPPTHINHVNPSGNDLGWMWANLDSDTKPGSSSKPVSPRTIGAIDRRDSHSRFEEDPQRRKSSTSTIASWRSPSVNEAYDSGNNRDPLPSPSGHPAEAMLASQRQSISHAYDDMLKRKIDGGTPGRPQKPSSFDIPSRGLTLRDASSHKPLTLRSLSLQERSGPSSPRKLSSSNNPHWDPGSSSVLTSPSITSSRQSYFNDPRGSPTTDVFSTASSVSSYGSSIQSKPFNDGSFGRLQGPPVRATTRESGLSNMMAQSSANSSNRSPQYSGNLKSRHSPQGIYTPGGDYPGFNAHKAVQDEKPDSSSRSLRPHYLQEQVVILPTHHPEDYRSHHPHHSNQQTMSNRHAMKRKGAPDSSERDGPPSQQLQQEGRRSPNPVTMPYASPQSNNSYPPIQHMSSSTELPPSVNPLSDAGHDRNSPYLSQLAIDPVLNAGSHPYPIDAQQLAAQAAQSVKVENLGHAEESNASSVNSNAAHVCECCPKKPKRFNTEAELSRHMNEKQYVCSYCHNRFKNKNEMERHQMSLHLRDRSWSCAALERNYEAAFHPSTAIPPNNPGHAQQVVPPPPAPTDVCGYCGQHFANPPDYLARGEHLTNVHKFAECNQSKKFWRADHFRQHLKHSHGGIPGKWTNMLEQACLKMETPLPQSQQGDEGVMAQQQAVHAARVAQAAAEQASQAVQQQQAQQQQEAQQQRQQGQHSQQSQHPPPSHHDNHHLPPLTPYQASQLQNATTSNGSSSLGESRRGPYPSIQPSHEFGPLVSDGGTE